MPSLTNKGQEYMILGTLTNGGIANLATALRLYSSASTPNKNGTGFTEVANGNGYVTGGWPIARGNWTMVLDGGNQKIVLDDVLVQALGGNIVDIAGAYIVDASNNVLAWWDRVSPITLAPGDEINLDDLSIKPT